MIFNDYNRFDKSFSFLSGEIGSSFSGKSTSSVTLPGLPSLPISPDTVTETTWRGYLEELRRLLQDHIDNENRHVKF